MEKNYVTPQIEVIEVEIEGIIAISQVGEGGAVGEPFSVSPRLSGRSSR